jgi:hypothetical protein
MDLAVVKSIRYGSAFRNCNGYELDLKIQSILLITTLLAGGPAVEAFP